MLCKKFTEQYVKITDSMKNWFYDFVDKVLEEKGLTEEIYIVDLQIFTESPDSDDPVFSCYFGRLNGPIENSTYGEDFSIYYDEVELKERLSEIFDDMLETNK